MKNKNKRRMVKEQRIDTQGESLGKERTCNTTRVGQELQVEPYFDQTISYKETVLRNVCQEPKLSIHTLILYT